MAPNQTAPNQTAPAQDAPPPAPPGAPAGSLPSGLLLAATGGMLDAFVYLDHGHVFASAMTGNGVLMGIALLQRDWLQAARHLSPAVAFLAGVAVSKILGGSLGSRAVIAGLLLELSSLLAASFLPPSFPHVGFTAVIAFVASYQVSSFRKVDQFSYNSTFITGNMRTVGDGIYESLSPESRTQGLRKARDLSLVILCFLLGAVLGALLAPRFGNHTLWFVEPLLLIVLLRAILHRQREKDQDAPPTAVSSHSA